MYDRRKESLNKSSLIIHTTASSIASRSSKTSLDCWFVSLYRQRKCDGKALFPKWLTKSATSLSNSAINNEQLLICEWWLTRPRWTWPPWCVKQIDKPFSVFLGVQQAIIFAIFPFRYTGVFGPGICVTVQGALLIRKFINRLTADRGKIRRQSLMNP